MGEELHGAQREGGRRAVRTQVVIAIALGRETDPTEAARMESCPDIPERGPSPVRKPLSHLSLS